MLPRRRILPLLLLTLTPSIHAQAPGEREPIPRLEAGGPMSPVQALVFSPDGKTLYEAGFDKVVRVWSLDPQTGRFRRDEKTFRVPVGPGFDGAINALALSPDGNWLAVGGLSAVRGRAGFHQIGVVASARGMSPEMREDEGTIFLFHTTRPEFRRLRGHQGAVLALAFAPARQGKPPLFVSAAQEVDKSGAESSVLRLWDVDRREELARTAFRPDFRVRQELAGWHTGADARDVGVAAIWGDAHVRLWEPARGEVKQAPSQPAFAAQYHSGAGRVAVLTHGKAGGQMEFWNPSAEAGQAGAHAVRFPAGQYPLAFRLLDRPEADKWGRAAVVVRVPAQGDAYLLHVVSLDPGSRQTVQATVPLWKGGNRLPVLALAPAGTHLAIAGAPDQAVRVFTVASLAAGAKASPQELRSAGTLFRHAAFATDGKERALVLNETARKKPGETPAGLDKSDLLFNVPRRAFIATRDGWKLDVLAPGPWQVKQTTSQADGGRKTVWTAQVTRDGVSQGQGVRLEGIRGVTDFALRPPDALVKVPLLAVAFLDEVGQPMLALYDVTTGRQVRQFAGHVGVVRCLAFSGDGRMLVSAADDQTVCVWSLTNLPNHLGRRGTLSTVVVREDKGQLVVAEVATGSPAEGKLKPGQVLAGFVEGGQLRPVATRTAFFDALLLKRPGDPVTLRVAGADVTLPVEQLTDEWKPLFSLFVTQPTQAGERGWIGWNPTGPYDARDPTAERFLGWHFNPAQMDAPVTFAAVEQYRERRQRRGILKHLLAEGSLSAALAAWEKEDRGRKVPEANLRLWLDDDTGLDPRQADGQGRFLVQKPPAALNLVIDDLPEERIGTATWQIEGLTDAPRAFASGQRTATADVAALPWARGTYRVRVTVRAEEDEVREVTKELLVRYQPPPPAVTLTLPGGQKVSAATPAERRVELAKPEFRVQAQVEPGRPGEAAAARLLHRHQGKEILNREWRPEKGGMLDEPLKLQEGENLLEVEARNQDAPANEREAETSRVSLVLVYTRPTPDPVPRIVLDAVRTPRGAKVPIEPGKPILVEEPKVQLLGTITGASELMDVGWAHAKEEKGSPLAKFEPGKHRRWEIAEPFQLFPGSQKFRLYARTTPREQTVVVVELFYRPRLPGVVLNPPERLEFYEGDDPADVTLSGRFVPPDDPHAYRATLLVDDSEQQEIKAAGDWSTRIALKPGTQRLQVRLQNAWGAAATSEAVTLRYLRTPRVVRVSGPAETQKPFSGPLTAVVQSSLDLEPTGGEVELNGQKLVAPVELSKPEKGQWQVRLADVPLREGANTVRLWVRTADGRCRTPGEWTIRYAPPPTPPQPPEVAFVEPGRDVNWTARVLPLRLRVQSAGPLKSVVLTRGGRAPLTQVFDASKLPRVGNEFDLNLRVRLTPDGLKPSQKPLDVSQFPAGADGSREVALAWPLSPGTNAFRLEAVNDGGLRDADLVVNYLYQPVRLSLTRLVPRSGGAVELPADLHNVPRVADGRVTLEGVLTWDEDKADLFSATSRVRARVNGFKLLPVDLTPARAKDRQLRFEVPLALSRPEGNVVEIELLDVKVDGSARREFLLDCAKPEASAQELHVLIIRPGDAPRDELTARATAALQAPAGSEVVVHGPFTGTVRRGQVLNELCLIKQQMDLRARRGLLNNLLVIYFEGAEAVTPLGHFFPTSAKPTELELRRHALTCDSLADYVADMAGAQLLLLDVTRLAESTKETAEDRVTYWPHPTRPGVLRYQLRDLGDRSKRQPLLLSDLGKAVPQAPDLKGVAARVADNFRVKDVPVPSDLTRSNWLGGSARDYTAGSLTDVLYDWHYPVSYATLRLGRQP